MRIRHRAATAIAAIITVPLAVAGCAAAPPSTGAEHASLPAHVHGIVIDRATGDLLLGAHDGIYTASATGDGFSRVGKVGFDAMGLTSTGDALIASGHPGPNAPEEWGEPNLGIIRSTDGGRTWDPVAFTGEKDFHALAAATDGTTYGIAVDSADLLRSNDAGATWELTGASPRALALTVDVDGRVIAGTPDGLKWSADRGESFAAWDGAPAMYTLAASPNGGLLVGVDANEQIWTTTAGATRWRPIGSVHGAAQAIAVTDAGDVIVVDDSGLTTLPSIGS
ncbi:F510_1955 family glycosylhydrolase [Microbacterium invictum]|nr:MULTISPECIES: hypothetical protein [Microbacterium]